LISTSPGCRSPRAWDRLEPSFATVMDHPGCQLWDHRRVVRRNGRGPPLAITTCQVTWRSLVALREVRVNEVREGLRCWLGSEGLRTATERAGLDRKTARRYVEAAQAAGLVRDCGNDQLSDALIGVGGAARARDADPRLGHRRRAAVHQHPRQVGPPRHGGAVSHVAPFRCGPLRVRPAAADAAGRRRRAGGECQLDFARLGLIPDPATVMWVRCTAVTTMPAKTMPSPKSPLH
jgi:hypothetical protein